MRFAVLYLLLAGALVAQDAETLRVTHRFDWRRSVDGKYQGLVYGYLTGSWKLSPGADPGWTAVDALYYLASESRRNNALLEKPIDAEQKAKFQIAPNGTMTGFTGAAVPYYRNFPAPLPADAGPGSVWTGNGELVADFLGNGKPTRIPILIEYRWEGPGQYGDTAVIQVKTQYALRYQAGTDPQGDMQLARADGTHIGVVSYDADSRKVLFVREQAKEQFTKAGGGTLANDGIVLSFYEGVPALGTSSLVQSIAKALGTKPTTPAGTSPAGNDAGTGTGKPSDAGTSAGGDKTTKNPLEGSAALADLAQKAPEVKVEADPRGVKLTLENLRFVADQAQLLPGEDRRLAAIAELLKTVPGRNILVVGHTAAVGTVESQDTLSVQRALAIIEKLKAAGVPPQRLLYEGRGGRDPIASNDTDAGRAQNRRVEVLILDQ